MVDTKQICVYRTLQILCISKTCTSFIAVFYSLEPFFINHFWFKLEPFFSFLQKENTLLLKLNPTIVQIMMGTMVSICITLPVRLNVYKAIEKTMIISFVHLQRLCNASFAYKILKYEKSTSTKLLEFVQLIQDALPHSKLQKKKETVQRQQ